MEKRTGPEKACAQRADSLDPSVPYVRGWSAASRKAGALAELLRAVGLEADFPGLRADVNVFGDGIVNLGAVRPEAVELLTRLLASGLAVEMAQRAKDNDDSVAGPDTSAA